MRPRAYTLVPSFSCCLAHVWSWRRLPQAGGRWVNGRKTRALGEEPLGVVEMDWNCTLTLRDGSCRWQSGLVLYATLVPSPFSFMWAPRSFSLCIWKVLLRLKSSFIWKGLGVKAPHKGLHLLQIWIGSLSWKIKYPNHSRRKLGLLKGLVLVPTVYGSYWIRHQDLFSWAH